jgi:hypothetical protein
MLPDSEKLRETPREGSSWQIDLFIEKRFSSTAQREDHDNLQTNRDRASGPYRKAFREEAHT